MKRRFLSLFLALLLLFTLAGCQKSSPSQDNAQKDSAQQEQQKEEEKTPEENTDDVTIRVAGLKGPTAMGMVKMMSDDAQKDQPTFDFNIYASADEITPKLVQGELDIAAVPANLASVLYNNTEGQVQVLAINTLGVLYVVENGETVNSVEDLKGKTIVTTGKGTTPEYVLRYILTENGVDPDNDVTLDFYSEATEALAQLQAGTSTIAMLPQPFVTSALAQVEGLRVALDMNEEWEKVAGSKLVTGVLVARKDAVEADPARFAAFMDGYKASVEAANTDLENTAALCEQYGIVAKAALAQKALPNCNIVFETGDEMKTDLETYFNVLYAADPTSVGGQLPADDFYYAG